MTKSKLIFLIFGHPCLPVLGRDRGRQAGELICYLACLREVPPCGTKAGAWDLMLLIIALRSALCVI